MNRKHAEIRAGIALNITAGRFNEAERLNYQVIRVFSNSLFSTKTFDKTK